MDMLVELILYTIALFMTNIGVWMIKESTGLNYKVGHMASGIFILINVFIFMWRL